MNRTISFTLSGKPATGNTDDERPLLWVGLRQPAEGSIMMGLGSSPTESTHFRNGEVLDRSFDTYQLPRFSWLPKFGIFFT